MPSLLYAFGADIPFKDMLAGLRRCVMLSLLHASDARICRRLAAPEGQPESSPGQAKRRPGLGKR